MEHGLALMGHPQVKNCAENLANFRAAHGVSPATCSCLWKDMWDNNNPEVEIGPNSNVDHFFWALHFLKAYPLERNIAGIFRANRFSLMERVLEYLTMIALQKHNKVNSPL